MGSRLSFRYVKNIRFKTFNEINNEYIYIVTRLNKKNLAFLFKLENENVELILKEDLTRNYKKEINIFLNNLDLYLDNIIFSLINNDGFYINLKEYAKDIYSFKENENYYKNVNLVKGKILLNYDKILELILKSYL
jgi:hypothetical protein